jgi:NADH-quinone oxidoreductase subunit M
VNDFPWLTVIAVVPFLGSVVVGLLPSGRELLAKQVALGISLVVLVLVVLMALQFDPDSTAPYQFVDHVEWIPQFNISYSVGVDGIALLLIGLLAVLVPVVIAADWNNVSEGSHRPQVYFALILALESAVVIAFAATDLFLFYVAFEVMLIPVYFMIGLYGGVQRSYAAVKFLLYSLLGGLILLVGVISLYVVSTRQLSEGTFDITSLTGMNIDPTTQKWLFVAFFIAFAVKAPMFPVHTWLPDAAAAGTPGTNTLLVGVLDKVGTFAMIRLCLPLFPDAAKWAAPVVVILAVVSVIYAALVAIGQTDMNRLIAYTSVSHFGVIILGIFAFTQLGGSGSTVYMFAHGLSAGALFITVGYLVRRRGSANISAYGGVARVAPVLAGFFLLAGLSSLSLPGMASFVGELTTLVGSYPRWAVASVFAVVGIVLSAIYILNMYRRVAQGPETDNVRGFADLVPREVLALAPVIALTVVFGFYPRPLFDIVNPTIERTLHTVGAPELQPAVPVIPPIRGGEG